jgi:CBS domain-containing protein
MPTISKLITRNVVVVRPDESVQRAAQLMSQLNVGVLPVYDGVALQGIVTDRDITVRATAQGLDAQGTTVSEVMTAQTLSCAQDDQVDDVLRLMGEAQVRRLPVLDRDGEIVGIVSLGDLAALVDGTHHPVDSALREISAPGELDHTVL